MLEGLATWVGIAVSVSLAVLAFVRSLGRDEAKTDARLKQVEQEQQRFLNYHMEHFEHAKDTEAHWNVRERDDLSKKLDEMGRDIKELLVRSGRRLSQGGKL